jgi:cobalamin-dependent methionine synthase-like protein
MDAFILRDIPFRLSQKALMKKLRIKPGTHYADEFAHLADEAQAIARPKALYRTGFIEDRSDDSITIDSITFRSRVLAVNLETVNRVFAYVATCGTEIEEWSKAHTQDLLQSFWVDAMKEAVLRAAMPVLRKAIVTDHKLGRTSTMAPGSLGDWPIQQQKPLFEFLGTTEAMIGVRLTDSFLMLPPKSVSGIWFPTETRFESCQLCPRQRCPNRRSPYDSELFERRYEKAAVT